MKLQNHAYIFFFVILGMYNVWAENYFVSPNGSNSGDGTESNPWPSFEKAIFKLRAFRKGKTDHVTLNLMAGTYYLKRPLWMNKKDSNMDIVAYNDADVTISGGFQKNLVWTKQGDHLSAKVGNFLIMLEIILVLYNLYIYSLLVHVHLKRSTEISDCYQQEVQISKCKRTKMLLWNLTITSMIC